jgi:hypothetical protein
MSTKTPTVRNGQGSTKLSREEFGRRYRERFTDPAYDASLPEVVRLTAIAWETYEDGRKSPHTRKANPLFPSPDRLSSVFSTLGEKANS